MDSILISIKKLLGIAEDYEVFDTDLIIFINTAFSKLTQLGVGPEEGYSIEDDTELWSDYLKDDKRLEMVKTYVYLNTKLSFDPPASGTVMDSYNRTISELEWRITVAVDPGLNTEELTQKEVKNQNGK